MNLPNSVIFYSPHFRAGGAERMLINYANQLSNKGVRCYFAVADISGGLDSELNPSVEVINFRCGSVFKSFPFLVYQLLKLKPDCLISSLNRTNIISGLIKFIFPSLNVILREPNMPSKNPELYSYFRKMLCKLAYRKANKIVAQHPLMKDEIVSILEISANKVEVHFNYLDTNRLSNVQPYYHLHNHVRDDVIKYCCVGRFEYQKGYDLLMRSLSLLPVGVLSKLHITLVGDGPLREELEEQVSILNLGGFINFVGQVSNPANIIYSSDVMIIPSRWEGFPNVALESLYLGTPIVITDCCPYLSNLINDNEYGEVIATFDDLSDKMIVDGLVNYFLSGNSYKVPINTMPVQFELERLFNISNVH